MFTHHRRLSSSYLAARPSIEDIIWLPYDAGLSAAQESHSYARHLPALFEFLHVDIQSTGHILSRPWSRQLNDVMSEIECAQLHSELFRRRHNTRQSHGLFALAKHLFHHANSNKTAKVNRTCPWFSLWRVDVDIMQYGLSSVESIKMDPRSILGSQAFDKM